MTIKELKLNYQSIVNDCRKADKTEDADIARIEANKKLEAENNSYMAVDLPIEECNAARRLYHGAWNAIAYPLGEEGIAFMADFDESRAAAGE